MEFEAALVGRMPPPEIMQPLAGRVLVRLDDEFVGSRSTGEHGMSIVLPEKKSQQAAGSGTIVRIGKKVEELQPGDRVLVVRNAGQVVPMATNRSEEHGKWVTYHEPEIISYWRDWKGEDAAGRSDSDKAKAGAKGAKRKLSATTKA